MRLLILGGAAAGDSLAEALTAQGVAAVRCDDGRQSDLAPAVPADAIVIVVGAPGAARAARALANMSDADWTAAFEQPLRQARIHLQMADRLLTHGGRVILVASTGGMAGIAGDVAGGAVEEGARALAKSVALAWQPRGITLLFTAFAAGSLDSSSELHAVVAPTIHMLLSAGPAFRGSTVIADGGVLLAP